MAKRTLLSCGEIIRKILLADTEVSSRTKKIFPVIIDKAVLPYIYYRRTAFMQNPVKSGRGAGTVTMEVSCYTAKYEEGVNLAEAVFNALDGVEGTSGDLVMRSCCLTDSSESWEDDAYLQNMIFTIKI